MLKVQLAAWSPEGVLKIELKKGEEKKKRKKNVWCRHHQWFGHFFSFLCNNKQIEEEWENQHRRRRV